MNQFFLSPPDVTLPAKAETHFFRPVWAEVDHAGLQRNFNRIRRAVSARTKVLAVVKANAYGHGLIEVSRTLSAAGAAFLGVTSIEESLALRGAGIRTPALILGNIYPFTNLEPAIRKDVRVTVASLESARMCDAFARKLGKKVRAHAKVDTGMGRIGVSARNALDFLRRVQALKSIELEGLYTHFSSVPESAAYTRRQLRLFRELAEALRAEGLRVPILHCANSAAILRYPDAHFSMVRPGISLYGVLPIRECREQFRPVLSWKSRIIYLKDVPPGSAVSYARTFVTRRRARIATAAFGYADGYRRALSNRGRVLVHGRKVPVIGRVTMDMTMLDVTGLEGVRIGDEVTILGSQGGQTVSARDLARWAGTSPYEIFCGISARVPRIHIGAGT